MEGTWGAIALDLASALDGLFECAYLVDRQRRILHWNKAAEEVTGYTLPSVAGLQCSENILAHVDETGIPLCPVQCPMEMASRSKRPEEATVYFQHRLGHRVRVYLRAIPLVSSDEIVGWLVIFHEACDTAALRSRMASLEKLALVDPLTGAGNRRMACQLMEVRQSALDRYGWGYGLAMFDIDGLKAINDVHGHAAGDSMLRAVAATAMSTLRPSDYLCRWGGDEFILILENCSVEEAVIACERIRAIVESTLMPYCATRLATTISAGATVAGVGERFEMVLQRADELLYKAKRSGRNTIRSD